tara:strand:+ start:1482 stop:2045 length:564 start_codon:yes stop_codon:yes gene_type:complete
MRIIGGNYRGKKILEAKDKETRPLKDLTKESIFNILQHSNIVKIKIEGSTVLDLFSGVGSFGLECLSRGAKHVTFIENYSGVLPILQKNLLSLKIVEKYQIIEEDIFSNLNSIKNFGKFNVIFLDPPYREKKLSIILDYIYEYKVLEKDGIIIIHRHKNENDQFPKSFKILDKKKYGISKIIFGNLN